MFRQRLIFLLLPSLFWLFSCSHHKKKLSLSGNEKVDAADFIGFFTPLPLPAQFSDSMLLKKEKDSLLISYNVFTQFVPDTALARVCGKGIKPKIYPLGKTAISGDVIYILTKMVTADRKLMLVSAFNAKRQFITCMAAMRADDQQNTRQTVTIDRKMGITKSITRKNKDGSINEGRDVFALNEQNRNFMMIMTDALEDKPAELLNPIDTLPRKHKYAADYGTGKTNLVSVRDGRKSDRLTFYIHIERNSGECTAELKGEALLRSAGTAEYRTDGDPCLLTFIFTSGSVTLKEESCGSHRGVQCLFDGSFGRRKDTRAKQVSKKGKEKSK